MPALSSPPPCRTKKEHELGSQSPIWQRPGMEITAFSFKLRANAPEGRKAISYQLNAIK
jgi:hypothetical protein